MISKERKKKSGKPPTPVFLLIHCSTGEYAIYLSTKNRILFLLPPSLPSFLLLSFLIQFFNGDLKSLSINKVNSRKGFNDSICWTLKTYPGTHYISPSLAVPRETRPTRYVVSGWSTRPVYCPRSPPRAASVIGRKRVWRGDDACPLSFVFLLIPFFLPSLSHTHPVKNVCTRRIEIKRQMLKYY